MIVNKRKRTCWILDLAVPADYKVKIKWNKKRNKYFDLARELKKIWHMKVTVVPIVIGTLGMIPKGLGWEELEIGGWAETIQIAALLRSTRILRRVLEKTCFHLDSSESPSVNAGRKKLARSNVIINYCFKNNYQNNLLKDGTNPCESYSTNRKQ